MVQEATTGIQVCQGCPENPKNKYVWEAGIYYGDSKESAPMIMADGKSQGM
jgi:hypothetical protein